MLKKSFMVVFLFVSILFLFTNVVADSEMEIGIHALLNNYDTDFYIEDRVSADIGSDSYDLKTPEQPSGNYSQLYSVVNGNNFILDSWNMEENSQRTLDLVYYTSAEPLGELSFVWDSSKLETSTEYYGFELKDYENDSERNSLKETLDMNLEDSHSFSNSDNYRYFELLVNYYYCGDNIINSSSPLNESCEGEDLQGASCQSELGVDGDLSCNTETCEYDYSDCDTCGDGTITALAGEECDCGSPWECSSEDLDSETCETQGFDSGTLSCNSDTCLFDTSSCSEESSTNGDSPSGSSGSTGGSTGSEGCQDECSEKQNLCVNSSYYKERPCDDFDSDDCLEYGNWSYGFCDSNELCYSGICIPRNITENPKITCDKLGYECGEYEIKGVNLNCGYCNLGKDCNTDGKCVVTQYYGLSFHDNVMRFFDLRKIFWSVVNKFLNIF